METEEFYVYLKGGPCDGAYARFESPLGAEIVLTIPVTWAATIGDRAKLVRQWARYVVARSRGEASFDVLAWDAVFTTEAYVVVEPEVEWR